MSLTNIITYWLFTSLNATSNISTQWWSIHECRCAIYLHLAELALLAASLVYHVLSLHLIHWRTNKHFDFEFTVNSMHLQFGIVSCSILIQRSWAIRNYLATYQRLTWRELHHKETLNLAQRLTWRELYHKETLNLAQRLTWRESLESR